VHRSKLIQKIATWYPLSIPGTLLFIIIIVLFIGGILDRNPYAIVIGIFGLIVLLPLSAVTMLQAVHLRQLQPGWDSSLPIYAQNAHSIHMLDLSRHRSFVFYRISFSLRGRLQAGNKAFFRTSFQHCSTGGVQEALPIYAPAAGTLHAHGIFYLRDVFFLTASRLTPPLQRQIPVRPPLLFKDKELDINAASGFEEQNRQKQAEEERYYMREYMPGDRFRDINWKTSSRLSTFVTRIPPHTQEKARVLSCYFRHFWRNQDETVDSIVHLNRLKSKLITFMRSLKKSAGNYHFRVKTGVGAFLLETEDDISGFEETLAGIFFTEEQPSWIETEAGGEFAVFSTAYDSNLGLFLSRNQDARIYLFRTAAPRKVRSASASKSGGFTAGRSDSGNGRHGGSSSGTSYQNETVIRLNAFAPGRAFWYPGLWIMKKSSKKADFRSYSGEHVIEENEILRGML
jgi:hypothetical protein